MSEFESAAGRRLLSEAVRTSKTPHGYYLFNSAMEEGHDHIRMKKEFDRSDIDERLEANREAVVGKHKTLKDAITEQVGGLGKTALADLKIDVAIIRSTPAGTFEHTTVDEFLAEGTVAVAQRDYIYASEEAYKETYFWTRELGDFSVLLSFFSIVKDPVLPKQFLSDYFLRPRSMTTLIDPHYYDTYSRLQSEEKRRRDTARKLVEDYAEKENNIGLENSKIRRSRLIAAFIDLKMLANIGKTSKVTQVLADLGTQSRQPQITFQLIDSAINEARLKGVQDE